MKITKSIFTLLLLTLFIISCDDSDPWEFIPPDFTSVPERYDISGVEPLEIDEGVTAYIVDEVDDDFYVTVRDLIYVYITLRTEEGDIIFSSFANGSENEISLEVTNLQSILGYQGRQIYDRGLLNSPGLKKGILGMKENERRTLVVEPEEGFMDYPSTLPNEDYRNSTLIYDVHIVKIDPS